MFKKLVPFFIVVETPLHAGSGSELGVVDQPIQRERHTGFPKIESSGLKGSIREVFESKSSIDLSEKKVEGDELKQAISLTFGPEAGDEHAGALGFTDARLLLFPVKSMKGVFAWITCPQVINRFQNELKLAGISTETKLDNITENTVPRDCSLFVSEDKIVLEEYTFTVTSDNNCTGFAKWLSERIFPIPKQGNQDIYAFLRNKIEKDIVVVPDDDFCDFVTLSTEVIARTKIDNKTGTVEKGALFYEEYLPQESILYSLALASPIFVKEGQSKGIFQEIKNKTEEERVLEFFKEGLPEIIQIGGNATIGKGIVRMQILEVKKNG